MVNAIFIIYIFLYFSDNDSYSSDESIGTFLANHKLSPSVPSRASLHLDSQK